MDITVNGFSEGYKAGLQRAMVISRPTGPKPADGPSAINWNSRSAIYQELRRELEYLND